MSYDSYHEDVQDELRSIRRENKESRQAIWIILPVAFIANSLALMLSVWLVGWLFGSTTTAIVITCAAYTCAILGMSVSRVQQRVNQMALHATSIHDEILTIKDLGQSEHKSFLR